MLQNLLWILLIAVSTNVLGQNHYSNQNIDSLWKESLDLLMKNEYAEANRVLSELTSRKKELKSDLIPKVYNNKGIALYGIGEYEKGIDCYMRALNLYRRIGNDTLEAQASVNLGMAYKEIGADSLASRAIYNAIRKFQDLGMERETASALNTLGNMYRDIHSFNRSELYLMKALEIQSRIGYDKGIAYSYHSLGRLMLEKGDYSTAKQYLFESLRLKVALGLELKSSSTLAQLGELYLKVSECDSAIYFINKSIEIRKRLQPSNTLGLALNHLHLGQVNLHCGNLEKSENYFTLAQQEFESLNASKDLLLAFEGLMQSYAGQGKYSDAYRISLKVMELRGEMLGEYNRKELAKRAIEYDLRGYKREIQLKQLENRFLNTRNNYLWGAAIILSVLLFIIGLLWSQNIRSKKRIQIQNEVLITKNRSITALHEELGHRTRNYFSLIRGMLIMDASVENKELVQRQIARIDAMAEVQKHLILEGEQLRSEVNLIAYLKELIAQNKILHSADHVIAFETEPNDQVALITHYSVAMQLGIVLNELINNSFKHTKLKNDFAVEVNLSISDEELFIRYADKGEKAAHSSESGRGMLLIEEMIKGIGGRLEVLREEGYVALLFLPIKSGRSSDRPHV